MRLLIFLIMNGNAFIYLLVFMLLLLLNFLRVFSVEHEVLEREIGRLRALYQQQQQQQPASNHRRSKSKDLDSQFANLSLKHKDANSSRDPVTGSLRI
jgi:hypothetical protein